MTIQEAFNGQPTNLEVNFYAGSYQYAEPKKYTIDNISDFEDAKKFTENKLKHDKANSAPSGTFWATFHLEGQDRELFAERVKVK